MEKVVEVIELLLVKVPTYIVDTLLKSTISIDVVRGVSVKLAIKLNSVYCIFVLFARVVGIPIFIGVLPSVISLAMYVAIYLITRKAESKVESLLIKELRRI